MKDKSKKKENKRSVFQYVIENLAIRRAPKVLLDSALPAKKSKSKYGQTEKVPVRNFGTLVERTSSPEEQPSLITPPNEKQMKTLDPTWSDYNLFKFTAPVEKHNAPRQNFTDAILLENTRQKKTVAQVYPVKNDLKVLPDVHKTEPKGADDNMPCEIKKTIAALQRARLPTTHKVRRARNHRTVLRGDSTTSFEPDTSCSSEITDSNVSDIITAKELKNCKCRCQHKNI
nr:unnamed protein product [Callosobruchus chinensis]